MPRSSRYALSVFLFSVLVFAGLAASHPRGVGASSVDSDRTGARVFTTGHANLRAAYLVSFDPFRPLFSTPSIAGVTPTTVTRSGLLRVAGVGFGATQGTSELLIDGKTPTFIALWSDTLIIAYVPEGAALGPVVVQVTNDGGTDSAAVNVAERQTNGRIRWSFNVASDSVPRRPAIADDGTIYLQDIAGRLYALAPDGALKWVFNAGGGGARGTVSVGTDGTVYAAGAVAKDPAQTCSDANLGTVDAIFAVNPDGTQKWRFNQTCQRLLAGPSVGPDGKVYAVTDKGGIGAFALTDAGALSWSGGSFSDNGGAVGSEIVFGPTQAQEYFQFSQTGVNTQGRLFGYTLAGSEVFQKATDAGGQPSVGVASGNLFITTHGGAGAQVRSYTPQGTLRWTSNVFSQSSLSALDAAPDETLYVTQDSLYLHSLTPTSGGIKWTFNDASAVFFSPVASPDNRLALVGALVGSSDDGAVYAVGASGTLLWKQQLPGAPALFPSGQALPATRARFTSDGGTAYVAANIAGDNAQPEAEKQSVLFALDTSANDIPGNTAPTATLTNPPSGAILAQNTDIQLTADVLDDGTQARVDFYRIAGGVTQLVGSDSTAPYSVTINTGAPGDYYIQAVATDEGGLTGESTRNIVHVVNEVPRVSFVTPGDNSWFPSGSTITITVHPTDIDGHITKVEFQSSRAGALGTDTTPDADGNYSVEYSPQLGTSQEGTQQIYAYPTDDDGARGGAFVNIKVGGTPIDPTPTPTPIPTPTEPGVRIVSPAYGSSFAAGSPVQISVEALDADGAIANVKLFRAPDATLLGTDTNAPYTFTLTDTQPSVYDLYAVATDDAGNSVTSATVQIAFYDADAPFFINGRIRHIQSTAGNQIYLTNALVKLEKDGAPFREVRTDSFGNYTFDHIAGGGSYRVVPSEPGYFFSPQDANVINIDDSHTFDFTASGPLPPPPVPAPTPGAVIQWERFYDGGQNDVDLDPVVAVDLLGNTIVAARSRSRVNQGQMSDEDITVVKYDPTGQRLWSRRYAGAGGQLDSPVAVRADANGNVYVFGTEFGGYSSWYNFVTIKYAPDGTELWVRTYNGPLGRYDFGTAMTLDAAGNVIVTGYSETSDPGSTVVVTEFATVKYDPLGNQKWVNRYSTARVFDNPSDVTTDAAGNVYVTGIGLTSRGGTGVQDAVTVKYTSGGARAWVARYNGKAGVGVYDAGVVVRHDGRGGLYVAGDSQPGSTSHDFFLAKYNDATGALLWSRNWAGPDSDGVKDMAVDLAGNVFVTGESVDRSVPSTTSSPNDDVVTVKFDGAGNQLWARAFAGATGKIDTPRRLVLDAVGNAYVAARVDGEPYAYTTAVIKYLADGTEGWVYRYQRGVSHTLTDAEIDAAGSVYVTGYAETTNEDGTHSADLGTFKLLATSPGLNTPPDVIITVEGPTIVGASDPDDDTKSPDRWEPAGPTIVGKSFMLKATASDIDGVVTRVDFYDGSKLLGTDTSSPYSFVWNDPAPGTHSVTAKATDYFGAARTSQAVNVTVEGDATPTPTPTPSPSPSPSPTPTPTSTPTPTPTSTPTPTPSPTPAATPTPTPSPTATPIPAPTPTPTASPTPEPVDIDDSPDFVAQHYRDFLSREADASGWQFWTNEIEKCGADAQCRDVRRINVSAAFFLSIEFQQTGYFIHRLRKATDGTMPRYADFLRDMREIGSGVVVGAEGWGDKLEANQRRFVDEWAGRAEFHARYDSLSNRQYVDTLAANAGAALDDDARTDLAAALDSGAQTRAVVLRLVADHDSVKRQEFNRAFVLMQYFGYLRRDPDEAGFNFWLGKLNQFNGDFIKAEMVKAFIFSDEYRRRFGQ